MLAIGEKIKELRLASGWSQGDLATRVLVSRQSVSKWENNITVPDIEKLVDLSELFDVSLDELILSKTDNVLPENEDAIEVVNEAPYRALKRMLWIQTLLLLLMIIGIAWLFFA
ncbi:helix-turn-helix domain-containing protein [Weissella confusa]|uniref:helix-turn-helix domain-containing protein n=1 Tax=Weissella confusa TaxID=1583 RepID=UPI001C0EEE60|nr:helix-turn-helix transcriptional regulator [Weissella confusa]